ncbi:MAG TPA: glutaredoxin family protein [Accumulibacter sp.]|nr:glutaredoxin family protein [Accumulibacter sp.]HMW19087.1 glutaredoxin family protein [Accumulibacter sp.]HMX23563.1 glutaredoxin family protein [Accumulibacter sp.]HMY06551.1 glutaredoxin family protein [Accumulibacter sp.]HNC17711.1 glutaredoxin family protein [Accumulibacter sp.]
MHIINRLTCLLTASLVGAFAGNISAGQTTYRWIDPKTGGTVISDQPPPPGAQKVTKANWSSGDSEPAMPYALRQASEKFPVVLYTSPGCTVCKQARSLLNGRGVPFSEKVIKNNDELAELGKQFGSQPELPSLRVGRQNSSSFVTSAWNELLDSAGYPNKAPYGFKPSTVDNE